MNSHETTGSVWPETALMLQRGPLDASLSTDVCVVGAGIAGLTTAYMLAASGRKVVVIDAGAIGGGETERTTAHLSCVLDAGYAAIERVHGAQGSQLAAQSHARAIDEIERIVAAERIDCGFERLDGYLFAPPAAPAGLLEGELAASWRAGIPGVAPVARAPLADFDTGPALRYPRQAQFHPLRYLNALAEAFERLGGRIFSGSRVKEVTGGSEARVRVQGGHLISAEAAVVATNTPFNDRVVVQTKLASYRSYAIAAPIAADAVSRALYWDLEVPFHYVRLQTTPDGGTVLIVGGADHKTGQADDPAGRYARLEDWARERFPALGAVSHRWSGQVVNTADGLAFIGRNPGDAGNIFIVAGDCGHGLTHGTIAGMMLPDLIAGRAHPWANLYAPGRAHARSFKKWAGENINAAAQYTDLVLPGEVRSLRDIAPGTGAIVRRGLSKFAVYRAPDGTIREFSARCPHLGAVVCWNSGERTWDCPAHGSRFDTRGCVLNGPASADLHPAAADAPTTT